MECIIIETRSWFSFFFCKGSEGGRTKLCAGCLFPSHVGGSHTTHTGIGTTEEGSVLASWRGRGQEDGLSPALTGDGGGPGASPTPPASQPRRSHLGDMFSSNHCSKWTSDWPGPNPYKGKM